MNTALVDLHLHLDGSINLMWAYKTALKDGIIDNTVSFEEYYWEMYKPAANMADAIGRFDLPLKVLQTKENIYEGTYNLIRELSIQGLVYAEIRFATQLHTRKGLSQAEALDAIIEGAKAGEKDFDITIRLINCMMHKGDSAMANDKENRETLEVTKAHLGDMVVATDLAGYENNCDFNEYGYLFEIARNYGIPYTIHAAEMGIGSHIVDALNMKPCRIGHGVECVEDPEWLKRVVEEQMPLEVCLSSNCMDERNYAAHQIRELLEAGAYVTVNTDNIMFSRTSLFAEHSHLRTLGISVDTLKQCTRNAMKAAFCSDETKKKCLVKIEEKMR